MIHQSTRDPAVPASEIEMAIRDQLATRVVGLIDDERIATASSMLDITGDSEQ